MPKNEITLEQDLYYLQKLEEASWIMQPEVRHAIKRAIDIIEAVNVLELRKKPQKEE